jgi:hypothetical protein
MLKYSGDTDGIVSTKGTVGWIDALGWDIKKQWQEFLLNK